MYSIVQKTISEVVVLLYALTAPLLDACVLGVLAQGDSYGYALTQQVRTYRNVVNWASQTGHRAR